MFAISMVLILAVVSLLVAEWVSGSSTPPTFRTTVKTVCSVDGRYQVPVEVENIGDEPAAGVRVFGVLDASGEVV